MPGLFAASRLLTCVLSLFSAGHQVSSRLTFFGTASPVGSACLLLISSSTCPGLHLAGPGCSHLSLGQRSWCCHRPALDSMFILEPDMRSVPPTPQEARVGAGGSPEATPPRGHHPKRPRWILLQDRMPDGFISHCFCNKFPKI